MNRRKHLKSLTFVASISLVGLACEPTRGTIELPDRDATVEIDAAVATLDAGRTDGTLHPDGTWLLFIQDRYCLYAAGGVTDFMVWSWYRVNMSGQGPGADSNQTYFQQSVKLCAQDQSPVTAGLITYVPAEVTAALPEHEVDGFLMGNRPGAEYLSAELVDNWGLAESVGPEDPLPESADDSRVIDQDGDGKPGVTMIIGNNFCDLQIVQRTRYRMSGEVVNEHRIEGTLWSAVNKTVFSASLPLCASQNQLDPRADGNRVVLVRIDGKNGGSNLDTDGNGNVDCAEIDAAREHLLDAAIVVKDTPMSSRCR